MSFGFGKRQILSKEVLGLVRRVALYREASTNRSRAALHCTGHLVPVSGARGVGTSDGQRRRRGLAIVFVGHHREKDVLAGCSCSD